MRYKTSRVQNYLPMTSFVRQTNALKWVSIPQNIVFQGIQISNHKKESNSKQERINTHFQEGIKFSELSLVERREAVFGNYLKGLSTFTTHSDWQITDRACHHTLTKPTLPSRATKCLPHGAVRSPQRPELPNSRLQAVPAWPQASNSKQRKKRRCLEKKKKGDGRRNRGAAGPGEPRAGRRPGSRRERPSHQPPGPAADP